MNYAPIVLFVYNRPDELKQTVEALQKNELAKESLLFIFSDGPKNADDSEKVGKVRTYIKTITGFKDIQIEESQGNRGLADSVIAGVTKIVNQFGKVIVLEDDLVTSPYFLLYMNQALSLYENDDKVASVSGYSYDLPGIQDETFFLVGQECWGWGTWKRAWKFFEENILKVLKLIDDAGLRRTVDIQRGYGLYDMLCAQRDGYVSSWSVRWDAILTLKGKLCLFPAHNLVAHLGYGSGTHCKSMHLEKEKIYDQPIDVKRIPLEMQPDVHKKYLVVQKQRVKISLFQRIKKRLKFILPSFMIHLYRRIRDRQESFSNHEVNNIFYKKK